MKITPRAALLMSTLLAIGLATSPRAVGDEELLTLAGPTPTPRPRMAILDCGLGWRASAQGQYGGAGFALSCQNGRGQQRLVGVTGTAYSVRIGAESSSTAIDCFLQGDAATVNETCGGVVQFIVR